jgi:hypothetical protein
VSNRARLSSGACCVCPYQTREASSGLSTPFMVGVSVWRHPSTQRLALPMIDLSSAWTACIVCASHGLFFLTGARQPQAALVALPPRQPPVRRPALVVLLTHVLQPNTASGDARLGLHRCALRLRGHDSGAFFSTIGGAGPRGLLRFRGCCGEDNTRRS